MINYPRITGATPGRPFLFRIPASGAGALTFSAKNLPAGSRSMPNDRDHHRLAEAGRPHRRAVSVKAADGR